MADLLTLDDAKDQLNIERGDTSHDAELGDYIASVTATVEDIVGPVAAREVQEVHRGGQTLVLHQPPVISVASITPIITGHRAVDVSTVDIDLALGVLRRTDGAPFGGPLRVTYTAGRASVPHNINLAARIIVAHLWATQRGGWGGRPGYGDEEDLVPTPMGFLIPNRAATLLDPHRRPPAVIV